MMVSIAALPMCTITYAQNGRVITELNASWRFIQKDTVNGANPSLSDTSWQKITVPHDWAISGAFQKGGLPSAGVGWYRLHLRFQKTARNKVFYLQFDGAMSHAKVYVNNSLAGQWPYGYTSFIINITPFLHYGKDNLIAVRLENYPESSRWYTGAGLYRKVWLIEAPPVRIACRGTFITTPETSNETAVVRVITNVEADKTPSGPVTLLTTIYDENHQIVAVDSTHAKTNASNIEELRIKNPFRWSASHPVLYYAVSTLKTGARVTDQYKTRFGIRTISFDPQKGMSINGTPEKLKGVCLHDDLGALGMAINTSALRHRLKLLKAMGCNAIRGAHNPHAPELLDLCDEMGFYYIDEAFDEWKIGKVSNGYHLLFDDWAAKDLESMIRRDRNHPALIMYSIGNEVKEQNDKNGARLAQYLTAICHRNDPTRPVTAAFNNLNAAIRNGLAAAVDIPGWNYKPGYYKRIHQQYPGWTIYGSETASTVSSRGAFKLPADTAVMKQWADNQSSAYDLEYCNWSQLPDMEWKAQETAGVAGEFAWTGFDYLGEPTPYNSKWPSRSSYFGIIDLSGLPKDRYYLYQSHWSDQKVLHLLPHWNWEGLEGQCVPVFVYTNYPSAELFINGKSFGKRTFDPQKLLDSYRLRWENAIYEPGELKVVAYDGHGDTAACKSIRTAGKPFNIFLASDRKTLTANGEDLAFVTVSIRDKDGNLCPLADNTVRFTVEGAGTLKAVDNGNAASLEPFYAAYRKAFFGQCMAIIQASRAEGKITIRATAAGLQPFTLNINTIQ